VTFIASAECRWSFGYWDPGAARTDPALVGHAGRFRKVR